MDLSNQMIENSVTIKQIKNNYLDDYYSNEQDCKIIKFFNENMEYLQFRNDEKIYKMLQNKYLFKETTTSLKNRFNNTILPNLYKYPIMTYSGMIVFYDRAGLEIPAELQRLLCEEIENQELIVENIKQVSSKLSSPKSSVEFTDFECTSLANEICICVNNVKHIFLLKNTPNIKNIKRCLIQEHGILRSNIHILQQKTYKFINEYKKHSNIFKYEIMNIIKPFLQLSEPIDIDDENEQISNKIIDLDKTKTHENEKSENLRLSKIFCLSQKPQFENQKLANVSENSRIKLHHSTSNNVNNFIVKHRCISSELVNHNEHLKQINILSKKQEQLANNVQNPINLIVSESKNVDNPPIKPLNDVNKNQVQKPIISRKPESKKVDNLSIKPSHNENDKTENLKLSKILCISLKSQFEKPKLANVSENSLIKLHYSTSNNSNNFIVKHLCASSELVDYNEQERLKQINIESKEQEQVVNSVQNPIDFIVSESRNVDNLPIKPLVDVNKKQVQKPIISLKPESKKVDNLSIKPSHNNDDEEKEEEIVQSIAELLLSFKNATSVNKDKLPIEMSHLDDNRKQDTPERPLIKSQLRWLENSQKRQNNLQSTTKEMVNNTETDKKLLPSNITIQHSKKSNLDSSSLNTSCDLADIPLSELKNILDSTAKIKSSNKSVYSDLEDVSLNIRKIKQRPKRKSSSTNDDSNFENVLPKKCKYKQPSKKPSSSTNFYTNLEDVPINKRNIKRWSINEIVSNINIDHCYGVTTEENNITNNKVITDSAEKLTYLEEADVNSTVESTIITDFLQKWSSRSFEPTENALEPKLQEENEMGGNARIENTLAISYNANHTTAESESDSSTDDILKPPQKRSSESSDVQSLYGSSELEMVEINTSTAWMSKIYQFSKRFMLKIKLHSLNFDHLRISFADPVTIKTEL